jgi:hypothetical protein
MEKSAKSYNHPSEPTSEDGYDILIIPFCRIPNMRSITLPDGTVPLSTDRQKYPNLGCLITDIDFSYEAELDTLPAL